ncbi:hypothetical protein [Bradyrhizobium sp. G127]|uniref:hypothetical protein n=1 Tax=Bradyrhizobium sp. G127 TaxID=2904800 RepID=UPI001F4786C3|nr:hypothetical protein [Bradyrhizobium sp. G127]MCF2523900.1 hypothetical protein [Bradyrhizobium sp. G127]
MQTVLERPADTLDSIPAHLAIQMQERQSALKTIARLRRQARDEIDRLIRFLDESDLDPDLEDTGDDEPSIGFCYEADLELDDCDAEDNGDREPSLGWTVDGELGARQDLELCHAEA